MVYGVRLPAMLEGAWASPGKASSGIASRSPPRLGWRVMAWVRIMGELGVFRWRRVGSNTCGSHEWADVMERRGPLGVEGWGWVARSFSLDKVRLLCDACLKSAERSQGEPRKRRCVNCERNGEPVWLTGGDAGAVPTRILPPPTRSSSRPLVNQEAGQP